MKSVVLMLSALVISGVASAQAVQLEAPQQASPESPVHANQQTDHPAVPDRDASAAPAAGQLTGTESADDKSAKAGKFVTDTVQSPLKDFNLVKEKIPVLLDEAKKDVYAMPMQATCPSLNAEVLQLDALLGPDLDATNSPTNSTGAERGAKLVEKEAAHAVTSAVNDLIPYRGWVRRISGAEKHSQEVAAAIAAGSARRAFLKGYSAGIGCKAVVEAKN
ncbi:hypothetical protein EGT07_00330 [Herbaspirillum sp. HC18]|nr:hypothetical protein EGT07_00330 [Herbaspirillum sp. HC18]